jgi:hypothetical protein
MSSLILPGHPLFDETLGEAIPPNWREVAARERGICFVFCSESGLMRPATAAEITEYLEGGEYDERLAQIEEDD